MTTKVEKMEKLQRQIDNIPLLKKMVKDMDRLLDGVPVRSTNESTMRGSQRSLKDDSSGRKASSVNIRITY